jgi:HK97 family phage major capsid protein
MDLAALRQKRNDLLAKMDTIAKMEGSLTDEQAKEFDAAEKEFATVDASIKRADKVAAHTTALAVPRPAVAERQIAERISRGPEASTEFETIGQFMHAVRFNPNDQRLDWHEKELRGEQSMGTGSEGGFAVPKQFRPGLLEVGQAPAVVRPRAMVLPAGDPPDAEVSMAALDQGASQNMYGGVEVTWIAEGASKAETSAAIREVRLTPQEVAGFITVTDKLLRNWQASSAILNRLLGGAIVAAEEDAFINGSGVGKPLGILSSAALLTYNRAGAGTVALADILGMEAKMLGMANPVWLMTPKVRAKIRALNSSTTGGSLIWGDGSVVSGTPQTLLGRPALMASRLPQLGAKGDLCLFDLSYYVIKDGSGPFISASEHVEFKKNKTLIKAFWNVMGAPWLNGPVTQENGDIESPFVALDLVSA